MKISIIYYSETGTTEQVARWIAEGANSVSDTETRLFNLAENDTPDGHHRRGKSFNGLDVLRGLRCKDV